MQAASIGATPAMVDKAILDGVDDFTVFNEPFSGPVPEHSAELELPGQGDSQVRSLLTTKGTLLLATKGMYSYVATVAPRQPLCGSPTRGGKLRALFPAIGLLRRFVFPGSVLQRGGPALTPLCSVLASPPSFTGL